MWDLRGALRAGRPARFGFPPGFKDAKGGSKSVLWSRSHPNTDGHRISEHERERETVTVTSMLLVICARLRVWPCAKQNS